MREGASTGILEESCPGWTMRTWWPFVPYVPLNRPLRDLDSDVEQLAADTLGTPQMSVGRHLLDQPDRLSWELRFPGRRVRFPLPAQPKPLPLPPQDRLRLDDQAGMLPR